MGVVRQMIIALLLVVFASVKINIVNPTSSSTWNEGQQVYIVWEIVSGSSQKMDMNLMDGSHGNNDAPLVNTIANNVDPTLLRLNYTVPKSVQAGKYFIQAVPNDGNPQYSSTFQIQQQGSSSSSSNSSTNSTSTTGSGNSDGKSNSGAFTLKTIISFAILSVAFF